MELEALYTPASGLGYWLGIAGGSLMLALLVYPLRKRLRSLSVLGPVKHWFRFHLMAGIAGPLLVLFHSGFHVGSFNAAIALASMLLVVASGLMGRFLYRKIHRGLYGRRESASGLQREVAQQVQALQPLLRQVPAVECEVARFMALATHQPASRGQHFLHFLSLGWQRHFLSIRIRRAIAQRAVQPGHRADATSSSVLDLADTIARTLKAVQSASQFTTFEKLFSLWHVLHIPFLCLLVITALVHVVAVHAY
jgi:hypothetical protein